MAAFPPSHCTLAPPTRLCPLSPRSTGPYSLPTCSLSCLDDARTELRGSSLSLTPSTHRKASPARVRRFGYRGVTCCLGHLADARTQQDIVASGQVGTIVGSVVLLLPAIAPQLLRVARRFLKPRKCYTCYGTGYDICNLCRGRGKLGGLVTSMPLHGCKPCRGKGKCLCRSCRGTGLANSWLYEPNRNSTAWGPRGE